MEITGVEKKRESEIDLEEQGNGNQAKEKRVEKAENRLLRLKETCKNFG